MRGFDEQHWAERRFDLVVAGNLAKFGQRAELRDFLIGTGSRVLVGLTGSTRSGALGWPLTTSTARHPSTGPASNLLGFALMEVRQQLRPAT